MVRLIIIRHGRTEWNRVERFRGRADIGLDEVGMKQARATAERIGQWQISAIYSSPLRRALTTAEILAQSYDLQVELLPGIIDIDYGEWQGLSPEKVIARDGDLYTKWIESPHTMKFPGGESLTEVRERAASAVTNLIEQYPKQTIAVVSHKVVCQILILSLLDFDSSHFWQIAQDVCAVNVFEVRHGIPSAVLLNDTCHLKELN